ncbi:hypothetical protein [Desulfitobacterium sp.]|uniref:hypothetical protein n=1 Tax=Desulfitobacterium sp. TaxID=49981 RepID=UPI002B215E38|nr:hypothetical protein [Desulfitobacterium sp.]MEA4901201.1 hypothetical protein [Desulfitobacterium sp.]
MFKTLWRIFVVIVLLLLLRTNFAPQTQAYIVWPENPNFVERVKFQMDKIQRNAQDLPANLEIELMRLWKDVKPSNGAKLV